MQETTPLKHGKQKMTTAEIKTEIRDAKEEIAALQEMTCNDYYPTWERDRDLERAYAQLGKLIASL